MDIHEKLNAIRKYFIGSPTVQLSLIKEEMKLDDGTSVEYIHDGYISIEKNREWEADMYFEDLSDNEIEQLYTIVDNLETDDEKTMKRASN